MLLWMDQPFAYSTATFAHRWTSGACAVDATKSPRANACGIRCEIFNALYKNLGSDGAIAPSGATAILAGRIYVTPALNSAFFLVTEARAAQQLHCEINGDGTISVWRGVWTGTRTLLGTTSYAISINTWYHVILAVTIHPSAGTVDLYIDSVNKLSLTGQNTRNTANSVWTGFYATAAIGSSAPIWMTDIYCLDGRDGTLNGQQAAFNTALGDRKIEFLKAQAGNGSNVGWTPSTGVDHGANVDDVAPNDTTDYNSAATSGLKDSYNLVDLASTNVNIDAVAPLINLAKGDAGAKQYKPGIRIGGIDYLGTAQEVPSLGGFRYLMEIMTIDPSTGNTSFLPADINAAEVIVAIP